MTFPHGEAFQFDWSCEYAWIGGLRRRGIYDNMKTAADQLHKGKERTVNARFDAMPSGDLSCCLDAGWWSEALRGQPAFAVWLATMSGLPTRWRDGISLLSPASCSVRPLPCWAKVHNTL